MKTFPVLNANRLGAIELIELGRPRGAFVGSALPRPQEPFLAQMGRERSAAIGAGNGTTIPDVLGVVIPVAAIAAAAWYAFKN